jgi:integrase
MDEETMSGQGDYLLRRFIEGTGLRRRELAKLTIRDIFVWKYGIWVEADTRRPSRRKAPVLESHEHYVLTAIAGRRQGRARQQPVFAVVPSQPDWYLLRRFYAQAKYRWMVDGGCDPAIAERAVLFWLGLAAHPNTGRRLYFQ